MTRRSIIMAVVAVGLLPFGSCTCFTETPEAPPKVAQRPIGFGSVATPRKLPEAPVQSQVEPEKPEIPEVPTALPTIEQSTVPDNFPEGVPVPTGAKVMAVQRLPNDARSVIFASEDDAPELFNLYRNTMSGSGWGQPTQQYQGKDQSFLSFKKGNTVTNISVSRDPKTGQRLVAVMYYEEKPLPFPEF